MWRKCMPLYTSQHPKMPPREKPKKKKRKLGKKPPNNLDENQPRPPKEEDPTSSCNPLIRLAFSYASGLCLGFRLLDGNRGGNPCPGRDDFSAPPSLSTLLCLSPPSFRATGFDPASPPASFLASGYKIRLGGMPFSFELPAPALGSLFAGRNSAVAAAIEACCLRIFSRSALRFCFCCSSFAFFCCWRRRWNSSRKMGSSSGWVNGAGFSLSGFSAFSGSATRSVADGVGEVDP